MDFDVTKHFGICYTLKCNVECPHCADACGPHRSERMDFNDIEFIIENAAVAGFKSIELYGGEPFLDFNRLSQMVRLCASWSIRPLIYTNGFWGKNGNSAKEKLGILKKCGLDAIGVSIDSHHQKNIPIDYPLNVLQITKELSINSFCVFCPSISTQDDKALLDRIGQVTEHITISQVFYEGRAKTGIIDSKPLRQLEPCQTLIRSSTVEGDIFACGSPLNSVKKKNILYLGNCRRDNIREALTNSNYYRIVSFFHDVDSDIYYKKISATKLDKEYRGICDFCLEAMIDQEVIDKLTLHNPQY